MLLPAVAISLFLLDVKQVSLTRQAKPTLMAHIADFMVDTTNGLGLNNLIARELTPSPTVRPSYLHRLGQQFTKIV